MPGRVLWTLLGCAVVLVLAAWLRGAEYDEQYTLFLTAGVPRPEWPVGVFPAGMAREIQSGHAGLAAIARDLRATDVHPPLYFWLVSLWREVRGPGLFAARLLSVVLGVGALALTGVIAQQAGVPPVRAMLFTLGCYGFTYTSVIARGFALAQLLLLAGVAGLLLGRRVRHFVLAGALLGAATLSNYLAVFAAGACLVAVGLNAFRPRPENPMNPITGGEVRQPRVGRTPMRPSTAGGSWSRPIFVHLCVSVVPIVFAAISTLLVRAGSTCRQFQPQIHTDAHRYDNAVEAVRANVDSDGVHFVAPDSHSGVAMARALPDSRRPERMPRVSSPSPGQAIAALLGFLSFIPAGLWWFLAQRDSRPSQFPPFALSRSLARLATRFTGDILGGLPLYLDGDASKIMSAALGLLLLGLIARIAWCWRGIGTARSRLLFACAALASPAGLMVLGGLFNNTPIEVRYLAFSTPFAGLLLAGALGCRSAAVLLVVQAASIAGLMVAPQTMQPERAAARAAAALVEDGVVLLPRGNDGVGVVGAFAIEAPPALPLLLIGAADEPNRILGRIKATHRVVLALMEQDADSRDASAAMRRAMLTPGWREVARGPNVAVYERTGDGE